MKKIMISLLMVVAATTTSFAKSNNGASTPLGRYTIEKKDGGISFMGMTAKVVSGKNGVYQVKSSLGNFSVNTRKGTVTKR